MAVKTDLDSVEDKKLVTENINDKSKEYLQVNALDGHNNDVKGTDIVPVETQVSLNAIKSSVVSGKIDVVASENVRFSNSTYFNAQVKIKKVKKKDIGLKNTSGKPENEAIESDIQEKTVKTSVKTTHIRRWYLNIIGLFSVTFSVLLAILFNRISSDYKKRPEVSSPEKAAHDASNKISSANILRLFYENLNIIAIAAVVIPLVLLLIANALLNIYNSSINKKKRGVDELEEKFDSLMRPVKRVKTAVVTPENLRLVSRTVWHAQPIVIELEKIRQPVPWAIISHTATGGCNTQSECVRHVRVIQLYHRDSKDWDDIGYNFLVGGDGAAYCGRGWDYIGAHTLGYNKYSMGISFIGTFSHYPPPKRQLEACKKLLKRGVALGKLAKDYKLFAHRQLWATHSPGDKLFDIIKEWPHFVKEFNHISELLPNY